MSNARKPTLDRKITPKDEAARKAALDESFTMQVDGVPYTLRPADITGLAEMRIRRETGYTVYEMIEKVQAHPGLDLLGCVMFAAEICAGREANLEQILGSISYASEVDVVDATEAEPVPQP